MNQSRTPYQAMLELRAKIKRPGFLGGQYNRVEHERNIRNLAFFNKLREEQGGTLTPSQTDAWQTQLRRLDFFRESLMNIRDCEDKQTILNKFGDLDAVPVAQAHLEETDNIIKDSQDEHLLDYLGLESGSRAVNYSEIITMFASLLW